MYTVTPATACPQGISGALAAAAEPGVLSDRGVLCPYRVCHRTRAAVVPCTAPGTGTGGKAPSSGRNFLSPTLQLKAAH